MANYRKSFNFRSGVQVDNDRFLVDGRGNVGVGTSAPNRPLDVYGRARINEQLESEDLKVSGVSTFQGMVSIGASIFSNPDTGIISATSYRGDGTLLGGVIAIATNGWVVNAGTLSTDFNAYVGPFLPGEGLDHLPVAEGSFQVGKGTSTFTVQPTGLIGLGTTLPTERLDVRGNIVVSGISTIQGDSHIIGDLSVDTNLTVTGVSTFTDLNVDTILDVDGHTELDNVNVSGVSTFNNDVVINGGFDLDMAGGGDLDLTEGGVLKMGSDGATNLEIYNNGQVSVISDNDTTGIYGLLLKSPTEIKLEKSGTGNETLAVFTPDGSVDLYYNDSKKFETTGVGVTVFGTTQTQQLSVSGIATFNNFLRLPSGTFSNNQIQLGNAQEFTLQYNSGSTRGILSVINNPLVISGSVLTLSSSTTKIDINDSVELYYGSTLASAKRLETTTTGVDITGILGTNELSVSGVSTVGSIKANKIGIGTDIFSSDLLIKKETTVVGDFVSTQGSITLSLGSDEVGGDNSSSIQYVPNSETLDISNRGSGDITFRTHVGAGALVGLETGGFLFRTGSTDTILAHLRTDGRFAINQECSEDQELDFNLVSNGSAIIKGNLQVLNNFDLSAGIATIQDLELVNPAVFSDSQNFHTTSGITTFAYLKSSDIFCSSGISSFIGFTTYFGSVCFGTTNEELYGASTDTKVKVYTDTQLMGVQLGLSSCPIYYDYFGSYYGGTDTDYVESLVDPRNPDLLGNYLGDPTKKIPGFGYGDIQLKTGGMAIISQDYINIHPSIAQSTTGSWPGMDASENIGMGLEYVNKTNLCMVGINTLFTRSLIDIGYGVPSMNSYIIPPRLNTADINTVSSLWDPTVSNGLPGHTRATQSTPDGLVSGGILFDMQKNQLKVATDSKTFSGIATFTNNGSGHESFVPPTVTDTERTALTSAGIPVGSVVYNTTNDALEQYDGTIWTSFVKKTTSDDISISVSGTDLIITVAGVGSSTLTLS